MRKKVTVIGAGNVGATCAQRIAEKGYADVVMVDIVEGLPQGKGLDILQCGPILPFNSKIVGTNDYKDTAKSDVVVITSGIARKPGMSRDDLIMTNQKIIQEVTENIVKHSPKCIIICVTNPLDAMTQLAWHVSKFPKNRVMGQSGVLDSARFQTFISMELDVSVEDVSVCLLGGHGDTMVAVPRLSTVGGIPLTELIPKKKLDAIVERTVKGGAEIVGLLKTGSAYYAPSAATVKMVEAILFDQKRILPCSVLLEGEYGIKKTFCGVPVKLGAKGVEKIIELKLNKDESTALKKSADAVQELLKIMKLS
jgi:malate dehydrogenase